MAFTSGTATDYLDLMDRLNTYAVAQGWTQLRYTTAGGISELILQGDGGGSDAVIVGMLSYFNVTGGYHNWKLGGFTGYVGANSFETQPGYSGETPSPVSLALWDSSIPYWFIVNDRRIIVVAKVNTTYQTAYLGWIQPFATPGQYPYPMLIGGSHSFTFTAPAATDARWRYDDTQYARQFWGYPSMPTGAPVGVSSCRIRTAAGAWRSVHASDSGGTNGAHGSLNFNVPSTIATWDALLESTGAKSGTWPWSSAPDGIDANLDGTVQLLQGEIFYGIGSGDTNDCAGEMEGVFWASYRSVAPEDIVTFGGVDHLVVGNAGSSLPEQYAAIALA